MLDRRRQTIRLLAASKTVSYFGGVCLLFNAMTGSGIPFVANAFATLGLFPPFVLFLLFAAISAFSCLFTIEAMQSIPGNKHFQGKVEFGTLVNFYFGSVEHVIAQFFLYGAIQCQAMNAILLCAQSFDSITADIFHQTCGVTFPSNQSYSFGWHCYVQNPQYANDWLRVPEGLESSGSPFGSERVLVSVGYMIVLLLSFPLSQINLDDNIQVQMAAFVMTCVIAAEWIAQSGIKMGLTGVAALKPLIPDAAAAFAQNLGPIILNFSCTIFVPSWINLKSKNVNAHNTVWLCMLMAVIAYGCVGLIPALAFPTLFETPNMLTVFSSTDQYPTFPALATVNKAFNYAFAIVMLLPSISMSFIVSHDNLSQNFKLDTLAQKLLAKFLCFVLPWLLVLPLQTESLLSVFIGFTGVLLVAPANFVIPFVIYIKCVSFRRTYNTTKALSPKQTSILKQVHRLSGSITAYLDIQTKKPCATGGGVIQRALTVLSQKLDRSASKANPRTPATLLAPGSSGLSRGGTIVGKPSIRRPVWKFEWCDEEVEPVEEGGGNPGSDGKAPPSTDTLILKGKLDDVDDSNASSSRQEISFAQVEVDTLESSGIPSIRIHFSNENVAQEVEPSNTPGDTNASPAADCDEFWLNEQVPDPEEEISKLRALSVQSGPHRTKTINSLFGAIRQLSVASEVSDSTASVLSPTLPGGIGFLMSRRSGEQEGIHNLSLKIPRSRAGSLSPSFSVPSPIRSPALSEKDSSEQREDDEVFIDLNALQMAVAAEKRDRSLRRCVTEYADSHFVCPTFVAVPMWMPMRGIPLAVILLTLTSAICVIVIGLQIWSVCQ
ncbi:hypothetical protein HDU78_009616 [Chytriomyces hyalinus]|nr:hypothetical protein HDU78_009616 [Chytriomyces hyalinus]